MADPQLSTGLPGLDRVLRGLIPGDNIVWQVDSIERLRPLRPARTASSPGAKGRKLVYFRFGDHEPLVPERRRGRGPPPPGRRRLRAVHHRNPPTRSARPVGGAYLVFDCLSTLAVDWNSDRMLGNFFMLTCPYILDLESLAYFRPAARLPFVPRHHADLRNHADPPRRLPPRASSSTSSRSRCSTATRRRCTCSTPGRATSSGRSCESSTTAEILTSMPWAGMDSVRFRLGVWNRRFLQAEEVWDGDPARPARGRGGPALPPRHCCGW